ncbi:MAG: protein-methionine-sulfoxide reductase heme-binding subunit MsrQ [Gammaproteobacteria bacterium]
MSKLSGFKLLIFLACLGPLAYLLWALLQDALGANPIEELSRRSGEWTLRFLLLTLAMTPLQKLLQQPWPLRLRRMLGLYTFFYASLHLLTYLWLDQFFVWSEIVADILQRPFILVGLLAFLLLLPLALTSNRASQRWLGRRWKRLHRLVYIIAALGIVHFFWLVKKDLLMPSIYLIILVILLGARLGIAWHRHRQGRARVLASATSK